MLQVAQSNSDYYRNGNVLKSSLSAIGRLESKIIWANSNFKLFRRLYYPDVAPANLGEVTALSLDVALRIC